MRSNFAHNSYHDVVQLFFSTLETIPSVMLSLLHNQHIVDIKYLSESFRESQRVLIILSFVYSCTCLNWMRRLENQTRSDAFHSKILKMSKTTEQANKYGGEKVKIRLQNKWKNHEIWLKKIMKVAYLDKWENHTKTWKCISLLKIRKNTKTIQITLESAQFFEKPLKSYRNQHNFVKNFIMISIYPSYIYELVLSCLTTNTLFDLVSQVGPDDNDIWLTFNSMCSFKHYISWR